MPQLRDISRLFDRTPVTDPDTGQHLFYGQLLNTGGPVSDSFQAYRRTLSLDHTLQVPAGRAVCALGLTWIVGGSQPEGLDRIHRTLHTLHMALSKGSVSSVAGFLGGAPPAQWWMDVQWLSDRNDVRGNSQRVSSSSPQEYTAILPSTAAVAPMDVVQVDGVCVLVKAVSDQPSGFLEARGFRQDWLAPTLCDLNRRVYDPVLGEYRLDLIDRVPAVRVRWQEVFSYENALDSKYLDGDTACLILGGEPTTSDTLFMGDDRWSILAVRALAGCWQLHMRRL